MSKKSLLNKTFLEVDTSNAVTRVHCKNPHNNPRYSKEDPIIYIDELSLFLCFGEKTINACVEGKLILWYLPFNSNLVDEDVDFNLDDFSVFYNMDDINDPITAFSIDFYIDEKKIIINE